MEEKSIHLKGLNGIRALAALSVVLSHTILEIEYFGIKRISQGWDLAVYGVTMFFTLSGFLITFLLLKEKVAFTTISIRKFYIRRVLRIWPLYFFYIILVLIIGYGGKIPENLSYYLFMGANIPAALGISLPLLAHYWSLGVEEQFYLFWPWLVKWFSPVRSITIFLILFLMTKLALRILAPASFSYQFICITRFDCMAIGALSAILFDRNNKVFVKVIFNWITQAISWLVLLAAAAEMLRIPDFLHHDVFAIATAVIILNVAFNKNTLINLEVRLLDFLGKISYGIYIYHALVIYCLGLWLKGSMPVSGNISQLILVIFAVVLSTILVSWLSYELLEKRFLKLKNRFSKVLSRS